MDPELDHKAFAATIHGRATAYTNQGCRCPDCTRAYRFARADEQGRTPHGEWYDRDWVVLNMPIAVIMRQAFSDEEAIAAIS